MPGTGAALSKAALTLVTAAIRELCRARPLRQAKGRNFEIDELRRSLLRRPQADGYIGCNQKFQRCRRSPMANATLASPTQPGLEWKEFTNLRSMNCV